MAKIRVNVLTTYKTANSHAFGFPLLINRPFFDRQGVKIRFYEKIWGRIYDCDVLFINSKFFRDWHPKKEKKLYDTLASFKKRIPKVIWFDTTDSTGTTQFSVMPFVDGYYKTQVLKDRSLYEKTFYGNRIFTDYYKNLFGIRDIDNVVQNKALSCVLRKEDAHKLHVSWNNAMYEWNKIPHKFGYLIARYCPLKTDYSIRLVNPDEERKVDILGRIGQSHISRKRDAIRHQRASIANILKEKFRVDAAKISRNQYLDELKNAKIAVSPFGLGEISCRDFEVIINGALLFKQDMSHLETWPPLYVNNETYVPFSWDLKDFEEKLRNILSDKEKIVEIGKKAQELYRHYLYGDGRLEFCNKVLNIIGAK